MTLEYDKLQKSEEEFVAETANMQRLKVTMNVISWDNTPYTRDVTWTSYPC